MIQHIQELFQETKTIIIPELGALTITNSDTGELMFMPFLKHDDGVLASFIANKEGISVDDARKGISEKVSEVLDELANGNTIDFGHFGQFLKDESGDVTFENTSESKAPQAPTPVEDQPASEDVEQEKTEPEPIPEPEQVLEELEPEIVTTDQSEPTDSDQEEQEEKEEEQEPEPEIAPSKPEAAEPTETQESPLVEEVPALEPESTIDNDNTPLFDLTQDDNSEAPEEVKETPADKSTEEPAVILPTGTLADEIKAAEEAEPGPTEEPEPIQVEPTVTELAIPSDKPIAEEIKAADTNEPVGSSEPPKKELNILEKEEIAANRQKIETLKAKKEEGKKKRKRGAGFYILILVILLIAAGGTYVGMNFEEVKGMLISENNTPEEKGDEEVDKMKEMMGEDTDPDIEPEPQVTDSIVPESQAPVEADPVEVDPEPVRIPDPEPTPKPVTGSNNQPYHIVAGVFGSEANAKKLAEKIQGMGYPAKTFARNGKTVVSVQSFATSSEAQAALANVKDAAPSGWVLNWPN